MTGASVLGITYKDGVMIAADTLGEPVCSEINTQDLVENADNVIVAHACSDQCCADGFSERSFSLELCMQGLMARLSATNPSNV